MEKQLRHVVNGRVMCYRVTVLKKIYSKVEKVL